MVKKNNIKLNILLVLLSILLFVPASLSGQDAGAIVHQPIYEQSAQEPFIAYAMINSEIGVDQVRLLYRSVGESGYEEILFDRIDDIWRAEISADDLIPPEMEYFIAAVMDDGSVITYPLADAEDQPLQVNIEDRAAQAPQGALVGLAAAEGSSDDILVFSPDPGSSVPFDDIYIAASLFNVPSIDPSSIRILIDNRDVTAAAEVSRDLVAYIPKTLSAGKHIVSIELNNANGLPVPGKKWNFTVIKKTKEEVKSEFSYRGKLNGSYSRDPKGDSQYLDIFKTKASFTGQWRWLKFKTDLKITSDEKDYKQSKNRYRLSLGMGGDIFKLDLGDFSPRLSKYTLDGKRVRGVGADLKLGGFNLNVVYGELLRPIQGRTGLDEAYTLNIITQQNAADSVTNIIYQLDRKGYTFKQNVLGSRISFGSGRTGQFGINILKAKDIVSSVNRNMKGAIIGLQDSTYLDANDNVIVELEGGEYSYDELVALNPQVHLTGWDFMVDAPEEKNWRGDTPQDNIVIGTDLKLSLDNRRIGFETGWAFSMLNTDIWNGPFTEANMDTLGALGDTTLDGLLGTGDLDMEIPLDPGNYENIFVINENMLPLIPIDIDSAQLKDDPLKAVTTMPSLAYNFKLSLNYFNNRLSMEYNRVGPEFNSLGNPYLQAGLREFILSDRVRLLKNKLFLGVNYRQQDNKTVRVVPVVTTIKTITANIGVYPGPQYPSFNFKLSSKPRYNSTSYQDTSRYEVKMIDDSTEAITDVYLKDNRVDENTMNATIGVNYRVAFNGTTNDIMVNYNKINKSDLIDDRFSEGDFEYELSTAGDTTFYDSGFNSPKMTADVTTISVATKYWFPLKTTMVLSLNKRSTPTEEQGVSGFNINGVYAFMGGQLKVNGGFGFMSGTGSSEFSRFNLKGGATYKIIKNLSARASLDLRNTSTSEKDETVLIMRADLNYSF